MTVTCEVERGKRSWETWRVSWWLDTGRESVAHVYSGIRTLIMMLNKMKKVKDGKGRCKRCGLQCFTDLILVRNTSNKSQLSDLGYGFWFWWLWITRLSKISQTMEVSKTSWKNEWIWCQVWDIVWARRILPVIWNGSTELQWLWQGWKTQRLIEKGKHSGVLELVANFSGIL